MFLNIINIIYYIFIFIIINLLAIFTLYSHIAILKTSWQLFDIKFFLTYSCGFLIIEYFIYLAYMKYIFN
ncbi:hypothetical protein FUD40_08430 [Campylobacter jejuni]|nr:hypothetical protein [Campylobacter jejuni]ECK7850349.1 hypothetical protein [Campylobacter jejuni]ECP6360851.1 hypothetical protein [Campylobacter jejuni]